MSNPILNEKFTQQERVLTGEPMTVNGALEVTAIMRVLMVAAAYFVWSKFAAGYTDMAYMLTSVGLIAGFIVAMIIAFTRKKALVPVYALLEGLFVGGVSAVFEASYPGIVSMAVMGTFAALFSMLFLYKIRAIKCTERFRSVVFISTCSIAAVYLVDFIGHFFHYAVPVINTSSNFGILFSLVVVAIAALNLIIDFDFIEQGARNMLPKDYEWYGAFGLMVTVVWLYIEILKLASKFMDRR